MKTKIRIFTDGACSKNPGPGGWAIIVNKADKIKTFSGGEENTTNNRMELLAVLNALKLIYRSERKKEIEFEIYSDSAYVVNAITKNWMINWKLNNWLTSDRKEVKNLDLWKKIDAFLFHLAIENVSYSIFKVKGHNGNSFNEMADELAKKEVLKFKEGKC